MSYGVAFEFEANEEFVELCFPDGTVVHIDHEGVEAELLHHPRDQFLLDDLAINDSLGYMHMLLQGYLGCRLSNACQESIIDIFWMVFIGD